MQYGVRVISTKRTGSQNPIATPGTGTPPLVHKQRGLAGFLVSLFLIPPPLARLTGPIEIGSRQLQQISVIGLTNRPEHGKFANVACGNKIAITTRHFI